MLSLLNKLSDNVGINIDIPHYRLAINENEIDENDAVLLLKLFHPLTGLFAQQATAGKPLRIDEALETLSAEEAERAKAVLSAWGYSTKLGLARDE